MRTAQAVQNLVRNALEHGSGEVVVTVDVEPGQVGLEVTDDGPGIAASLGPAAFEPFTRAAVAPPSMTPDQPRGAGLGLAIVKAVAVAHGGTATAVSGPGRRRRTGGPAHATPDRRRSPSDAGQASATRSA